MAEAMWVFAFGPVSKIKTRVKPWSARPWHADLERAFRDHRNDA